ncbi:MAG: cyclase family protein [Blastocatellia bacterium]
MSNALQQLVSELASGQLRVVDLTQPLSADTPVLPLPKQWADAPPFRMWEISRYDEKGPFWYWNAFETSEHTGTHFDAPIHWVSGKDLPENSVDLIPPKQFIGPACVIDISEKGQQNPDYLLTPDDILAWEAKYGRIPAGAWVLLRTDWAKRNRKDYLNVGDDGPHFPGWRKDCSEFLAQQRNILGVGVETCSTDCGQAGKYDPPHFNHYIMHGHGKFGLASLCNLDQLPPTGALVIAAPLKIVNGSGSPVRVIAIIGNS